MNARNPKSFHKGIATVVVMLLAVHVLLCVYFTVTPRKYILHASALGALYHRFFLIGPFFAEERITSSTQVYMRYKVKNGAWSQLSSYTDAVHREDGTLLHQYNDSRRDDLLRYFARAYRRGKIASDKPDAQLCVLSHYTIKELIPQQQTIDSINLLYIHQIYLPDHVAGRKSDTLWNVTFNPDRCAP